MQYCNSMIGKLSRIVVKHPKNAFISQSELNESWRDFNYIEEPDFEKSVEEYNEFLSLLKNNVEKIDFLPSSEQVGLDSIYAHDPIKAVGNGVIILKSGKKLREKESEIYRKFLSEHNIPIIGELNGNAKADGGDIILLDEETLLVGRGYRTNDEAIKQLREMTKDFIENFIVVQLPHDRGEDECLHLMSFLSLVDKDLAVVYSKLMPVFLRQILLDRQITLIEVNDEEYETLGCNVLALAPRTCLMVSGNNNTKEKLEKQGATVFEYDGHEISYLGTGGPTCLVAPIIRENIN